MPSVSSPWGVVRHVAIANLERRAQSIRVHRDDRGGLECLHAFRPNAGVAYLPRVDALTAVHQPLPILIDSGLVRATSPAILEFALGVGSLDLQEMLRDSEGE